MFIRNLYSLYDSILPVRIRRLVRNMLAVCRIRPVFHTVQIALTYCCNADCYKCSIARYKRNEKELSTDEVKSLIDQLYKIRIDNLGFFGGEPLLRKDVFELIAYASGKGIKTSINTNGYLLSKKTVKRLKDAGLSSVYISLDSSDETIHDNLHKLSGCFKKAIGGVRYCVSNDIITTINTVATRENVRKGILDKIVFLGKKLNVAKVNIISPVMIGGWLDAKKEMLEASDYEKIIPLTKLGMVDSEIKKHFGRLCMNCMCRTGTKLYISCYGDVQPCWAVPISFGNTREKPLKDIVRLMKERTSLFSSSKYSSDCIVNDMAFRTRYLKKITRGPLRHKLGKLLKS